MTDFNTLVYVKGEKWYNINNYYSLALDISIFNCIFLWK